MIAVPPWPDVDRNALVRRRRSNCDRCPAHRRRLAVLARAGPQRHLQGNELERHLAGRRTADPLAGQRRHRLLVAGRRRRPAVHARQYTTTAIPSVCLDAVTGKEIWKHSYDAPRDPKAFEGGPTATPAVDGNRVYTLSRRGDLFCFDAATGKVVWSKNVATDLDQRVPSWGTVGLADRS